MSSHRPRRTLRQMVAVAAVIVIGALTAVLAAWPNEEPEAAVPVQYLPAAGFQSGSFTPQADLAGTVTIKALAPFGGSGSNHVCDRELLIHFLTSRPDRLRAWARVHAIKPTVRAVARYIRSLRPATLVAPTRVTNYSYVNGHAVAFQAILGVGTAVLVDDQGAVRVRCRCGNPLQDPAPTIDEQCDGCPANQRLPNAWRLAGSYYALHPSPPPVKGEEPANEKPGRKVTVRMIRVTPHYILEESEVGPDGKTHVRKIRFPKPPEPKVVTKTRTVYVPRTITVERPVTVYRTITVPRTVIVYRTVRKDEG